MKKQYMMPTVSVQRVELQQMIATSPAMTFTENGGKGKLQDDEAEGDALSRRGNLWDD